MALGVCQQEALGSEVGPCDQGWPEEPTQQTEEEQMSDTIGEPLDTVTFFRRTDNKWAWHRQNSMSGDIVSTDGGQGYENYQDAYDQAYEQFGDNVEYLRSLADPEPE